MPEIRESFKTVLKVPDTECVLSMCIFKERLIVCTSMGVYKLDNDDVLRPIEIVIYETEYK